MIKLGIPVFDVVGGMPSWAKYFIFLGLIGLDAFIAGGLISIAGIETKGFLGEIITQIFRNLFGIQSFYINSFQLLVIATIAPIILYMFKNRP